MSVTNTASVVVLSIPISSLKPPTVSATRHFSAHRTEQKHQDPHTNRAPNRIARNTPSSTVVRSDPHRRGHLTNEPQHSRVHPLAHQELVSLRRSRRRRDPRAHRQRWARRDGSRSEGETTFCGERLPETQHGCDTCSGGRVSVLCVPHCVPDTAESVTESVSE